MIESVGKNQYAREHHMQRYTELLGDVRRSKARRVGDYCISHEGFLVAHCKELAEIMLEVRSNTLILAFALSVSSSVALMHARHIP